MPDPMTPYDLIVAAGIPPEEFATKAWAPVPDEERPALVSGLWTREDGLQLFVVIRAWRQGEEWSAYATVSKNPAFTIGELTPEEAERLRAESQTAQGLEAPVGQEQVLGRSEPVPYTPPIQALDTAESVQADAIPGTAVEIEEEIGALGPLPEPLDCGPNCVRLKGPEGAQDYHGGGCTL